MATGSAVTSVIWRRPFTSHAYAYLSGVFRPPTSTVPIVSRLASSAWAEPAPPFLTAAISASRSAVVAYRSTVTLSGRGDVPAAPPAAAAVPAYVSLWASAARPVNARAIATSTHCRRLEWFIIVTPVDRSRGKYRRVTGVQRAGAPCSSEGASVPGRPGPTENSAGS